MKVYVITKHETYLWYESGMVSESCFVESVVDSYEKAKEKIEQLALREIELEKINDDDEYTKVVEEDGRRIKIQMYYNDENEYTVFVIQEFDLG